MPAYLVVNATITDPAGLDEYLAAVSSSFGGHDITVLAASNEATAIEGRPAGPRLVILRFPDEDSFRAWYDSPEYQAVVGLRHASTAGFAVLADGLQ